MTDPLREIWPREKLDAAEAVFDTLITPELLEEAEIVHRRMSYVSPEDLLRPFTI
jgi:hypothetical protein